MRLFIIIAMAILCSSCYKHKLSKEEAEKQYNHGIKDFRPAIDLFTDGKYRKALQVNDSLQNTYKKYPIILITGYTNFYAIYDRMNLDDSALLYQNRLIDLIEKNELDKTFPLIYSHALVQKAATLFKLHLPEQANELFFTSQKFSEANNSIDAQFEIQEQMAYILYRQTDFQQALVNFKKSAVLYPLIQPKDYFKQAELINNTALCFNKLKIIDSAIFYYNKALQLVEHHQDQIVSFSKNKQESRITANKSKGVILGNLAHIFMDLRQLDTAIVLSKKSIEFNTVFGGEQRDAQLVQMRLIDIYGRQHQLGNMAKELASLRKNLDTLPSTEPELNYQKQMAKYYEVANQPQKAYSYFKRYVVMNDSLNALEHKDAESNIVKDLQLKKQEADLGLLKKNNQLNTLYLYITIGLIVASFIIIALVHLNFKKSRKANATLTFLIEQVNKQKVELELANKDKDRILRVVAHDLRNPIGGIAALSKTVIDEGLEDAKQGKYLQLIEKTANSSLGLINELLQANTLVPATNFQDVNLNQLLQHTVTLTQHQAQAKQQTIALQLPVNNIILPLVYENFERVMVNLITNAVKFSPANTAVTVVLQQDEQFVKIIVRDKGIGIPAQHIKDVFTALPSIKRIGTAGEKSFGLGLSICKQIIEANNGKIWVESVEGQGTSVYIQMPLASNE